MHRYSQLAVLLATATLGACSQPSEPQAAQQAPVNNQADEAAKKLETYQQLLKLHNDGPAVQLGHEIVDKYPWVPINMYQALNESKAIAMQRMENPRIVPLVWYREAWEEQEAMFGTDPWQYGLTEGNLKTLETLVGYSFEQGLIRRKPSMDELFLSVSQGARRGDEFTF